MKRNPNSISLPVVITSHIWLPKQQYIITVFEVCTVSYGRSFYRSDWWPKHEAHMHKSERKKTRGVTCRSLSSNGRSRAVKYDPLNWPIMAHILTERYNNLQQVSYWLPPACLEKVLFGEQPFLQDTGKNNTGRYWNSYWAWLIVHCNTVQIPW